MSASVEIFGPPLLLLAVSGLYFAFDKPDTPMRWRLATSAHGAIAFVLFLIAYLIGAVFGGYRPYLAWPYILSFLIPVISILYALFHYRGPRLLHILQGPSIAAMLWVMFVGGMAITGDWL
jgi:hypothetical protein